MPPGLGKQDKSRAKLVLDWFNAMANGDEKALLRPAKPGYAHASAGERRIAIEELGKLVIARLCEGFASVPGGVLPRELGKGNLSATALENRVRALEKKKVSIVVTAAAFAAWRANRTATSPEESAAKRLRTDVPGTSSNGKAKKVPPQQPTETIDCTRMEGSISMFVEHLSDDA